LAARILQATSPGQMMSCAVFDELILDYFEGFITASEFHIFEAHFDTCPRCQRLMVSIQMARELCQEVRSVEVPEGLHERIMSVTASAHRPARGQQSPGGIGRLILRLRLGAQRFFRPLQTPEFVTAVLLCLATVGLLLVDFSDDMSLHGVYRQARLQIAEALHRDHVASRTEGVVSDLRQAKTQLNNVIEAGISLFSKTPEQDSQTHSDLTNEPTPRQEPSLESPHEPVETESVEAPPPSPKPETR
jgi:hypothetical protein